MEQKKNTILLVGLFSFLLGLVPMARAQIPQWEKCERFIEPASEELLDPEPRGPVDVTADQVESEKEGISIFSGDVKFRRRGQWLDADEVHYDKPNNTVKAFGDVRYQDATVDVISDSAKVNLETDIGVAENARYFLRDYHARGEAAEVEREGSAKSELQDATFTTCDIGDNAWQLKASQVSLDHEEGVGWARHARLKLWDVPILYAPFLRFPIDDRRKSGFLVPSVGSSSNSGVDISTPYYWNIAPDRDATITPRYLSERGPMLEGELRYLNPRNQGKIQGSILPHDDRKGDYRGAFSYQHTGSPWSRWFTNLDINLVSDDTYFEDLGNSLSIASTTYLNNQLDVSYQGEGWYALGRFQGFQTIDRTIPGFSRPHQRLPQLLVDGFFPDRFLGLDLDFHGEVVNFQRDALPNGVRLDLWPTVSLPFRTPGTFFTPSLGVRDTRYFLDDTPPGTDNTVSRTLPVFSIDTGAVFERSLSLWGSRLRQTLEPRAYYLYIPFENQEDFPVFDSAPLDFYFARLFQPNRFTGADRLNDANQLTLAVTTRLLQSSTGDELLRASIGQIQFFRDRKVTLPGFPEETDSSSSIIAEMAARLAPEWSLRGELRFDPHQERADLGSAELRYRGKGGSLLNMGYRFRRQLLEQVDISGRYPITKNWSVVGRWYHSIADDRLLEVLGGVEYDSCCWAIRLVGRSYITNIEGDRNNSVMVQLELKGLGNLGQNVESLLRRTVLGYGEQF
ncbi:LPS-assembly protein LptD [Nitrosococcus halophilus]|nr:LPS assembly protein LptD [Nitrosococcus halophilus]